MKKQVKLHKASGKTIAQVIEGYDDLMIVYTDDTFSFLHPKNGYESDADFEEPDYLKSPSDWCIDRESVVQSGVMTKEESDEKERQRMADWEASREREERQQFERLKAKFGQ